MGKGHARNEDIYLNKGGANETSASELRYLLDNPSGGAVDSVNGETGDVVLDASDISTNISGQTVQSTLDEKTDKISPSHTRVDSNTKLLLHFNESNDVRSTVDASLNNHTSTFFGLATIINEDGGTGDVVKLGDGALYLSGDGDYIDFPDSSDWDIFENTVDDWTIEFFSRFINSSNEHYILSQEQDGNNRWIIEYFAGAIYLVLVVGGSIVLNINGGSIPTNTYAHVVVIKKGNKYGIYVDGIQVAYGTTSSTITLAAPLTVGRRPDAPSGSQYLHGYLDELRIVKTNTLNADPNAGLTDTITVPTAEYDYELAVYDINGNLLSLSLFLEKINQAYNHRHVVNKDLYLDQYGANQVSAVNAKSAVDLKHASGSDNQDASTVPFTPDGDIASTDVQSAIIEVRDDTDSKINDIVASDISTNETGETVQSELDTLNSEIVTKTSAYRTSFINSDLSSGILTVTHNLGQQIVLVQIYDNNNKKIEPDEITLTNSTSLLVDLTSFGSLSGTWNIIVVG